MPVITYGYYQQEAAWTGSWTGSLNNPSAADATNAVTGVICAASALSARRHTSCKRLVGATTSDADIGHFVACLWFEL
jgi:hypothetical protein